MKKTIQERKFVGKFQRWGSLHTFEQRRQEIKTRQKLFLLRGTSFW